MRALIVGLGGVGQRHLRNLKSLHPECDVIALRHRGRRFEIGNDMSADTNVDIVEKYDVSIVSEMSDAIAQRPDFAIIANPSAQHVSSSIPLIEAGIPVFIEKPAATDEDDFELLETASSKHGTAVGVAYQLRWHPCVRRLRDILIAEDLGELLSAEVAVHSHMPSWHAYEKPNEFYAGVRALGGGVIMTEIHEIDLIAWLLGRPDLIFATGGTLSDLEIDVEDTVSATLRVPRPTGNLPVSLTLSFVQAPPSRRFVVNGTKGVAVLEIPKLRLAVQDPDGAQREVLELPDFDRNQMFIDELTDFIQSAREGRSSQTSLASIRDGQHTAFALRRSLDTVQPEVV